MKKNCTHCQKEFEISKEEINTYSKVDIVLPTICFRCRIAQHFAFWPFGKFRIGTSELSGEQIITTHPEKPRFPIYTSKEWHSDA